MFGLSPLEVVAAVVGAVSVWLSARQNIWSWPTAIVNVLLSAVVYYRTKLYSDAGLQFVYFALSVYGWYEWRYGGAGRTELPVSRTPRRQLPLLVVLGALGALARLVVDEGAVRHVAAHQRLDLAVRLEEVAQLVLRKVVLHPRHEQAHDRLVRRWYVVLRPGR